MSVAIKLMQLSDLRTEGLLRWAANRSIHITQLLVSVDGTTLMESSQEVEQVRRNPGVSRWNVY